MEQNPATPQKGILMPALQYGLLTAVGLIALTLFSYFANLLTNKFIGYVAYAIMLAGIILGTKNFRDEFRTGFISYGNALGFGTLTIFFASIISAVFTYIFYTLIAPDALEQLRAAAEINILQVSPDASDAQLDMAMRFVSPGLMAVTTVFSYTFVGFILSLITSAFLKKKDPLEM